MPLKLHRRGKIWYYAGTVGPNGRKCRLRGSCNTTEKDIAARYVAALEKSYWDGHFDGPSAVLTFEQACLNYLAAGKVQRNLGPARKHFGNMLVKDITPQSVQEFAMSHYGHCTGASRNRQGITPVVAVINHAAKSGLCSPIKVEHFPVVKKAKKWIDLSWVQAFQAVAPPHLGALALFMFLTGARPSEALAVDRKRDLNLPAGTVIIRQSKVSEERTAHLQAELVATLANLEEVPGRPLFGYKYYDHMLNQWKYYARKAKLPRLTPHRCRHGFITELCRIYDPKTVHALGGPSPKTIMENYLHAIDRRDLTNVLADTRLTQEIMDFIEKAKKTGT